VTLLVVLLAVIFAGLTGVVQSVLPLLAATAVMAAGTFVSVLLTRRGIEETQRESIVLANLVLDVVVLAALLHFSGGVDNPFTVLYVIPVAVAGMLLPARKALLLALTTALVQSTTMLAELSGMLAHHPIRLAGHELHDDLSATQLWSSPTYVLGYCVAFLLSELGVLLVVHTIMRQLRHVEAERLEHYAVAQSRERMARIGALAAGVAHTVRNPLQGLTSCLDLIRTGNGASAVDPELVELMSEGVQRIERVTRRLLRLAREDATALERTELRPVVDDALRFVECARGERRVPLSVRGGEGLEVRADPAKLSEALANLLDNAIAACTQAGEVQVEMGVQTSDGRAFVRVRDTGVGIAPEDLARVFDPFFTTKPIGEGTGLGLAISRRIVEDQGGTISVESALGRGTEVSILLVAERT